MSHSKRLSNEELANIIVPGFTFLKEESTKTHAVHRAGHLTVYTHRDHVYSLAKAMQEEEKSAVEARETSYVIHSTYTVHKEGNITFYQCDSYVTELLEEKQSSTRERK
jgi:hypothetical protein